MIAEHRLTYLRKVADRVIYMEEGRIVQDLPAEQFWQIPDVDICAWGLRTTKMIEFHEGRAACIDERERFHIQDLRFSRKEGLTLQIPELSLPCGAIIGTSRTFAKKLSCHAGCESPAFHRKCGRRSAHQYVGL